MNHSFAVVLLTVLCLTLATACSKPPDQDAPAPPPPRRAAARPDAAAAPAGTSAARLAAEAGAAEVLEAQYLQTTDLRQKMVLLAELSDTEARAALPVLGRLFHLEPDLALKEEILYSVQDVEGEMEVKLLLLAEAVATNQPQRIRLAGIDAVVDLEDRRGALVVQNLVNDPDPEIREAATDALEELLDE
ncbi:hypothetical protein HQ590_05425 [bacterium]|nr:hypothetical protein [bacterium]